MTGKRFQILKTSQNKIVGFGVKIRLDVILVSALECIGYEHVDSDHSIDFDIFIEEIKLNGETPIDKSKYYGKKILSAEEVFRNYMPPHKVIHPHKSYTYTSYIYGDFHKTIIPMLLSEDQASNLLGYQWMLKNLTFDEFTAMVSAAKLLLAPYNTIMQVWTRSIKESPILGQLNCGERINIIQKRFENDKKISNN